MLRARPCSSARISYSRDLTNLSTSNSPCLKALELVWVARKRASRILLPESKRGRLAACCFEADEDDDCLGGSLRFVPCWPAGGGPLGGMLGNSRVRVCGGGTRRLARDKQDSRLKSLQICPGLFCCEFQVVLRRCPVTALYHGIDVVSKVLPQAYMRALETVPLGFKNRSMLCKVLYAATRNNWMELSAVKLRAPHHALQPGTSSVLARH